MNNITKILIYLASKFLKVFYFLLKLLPIQNNKIIFLSRQSDKVTIDFKLIQQELLKRDPNLKIEGIYRKVDSRSVSYVWDIIKSCYHLATSKVCVLDSYWPAVSILNHKEELHILQIWHSIGKVKKSGYQTIGKAYGRNEFLASALRMHKNYDAVIAGAKSFNDYYCKSFGIDESIILNYGLPRIDYMLKMKAELKKEILKKHPKLKKKINVLYAPTFRKGSLENTKIAIKELIDSTNFEKINLIIKTHPVRGLEVNDDRIFKLEDFSSLEVLSISDYLITDYSAISIEAAILNVKTLYYVYDYTEYMKKNGLNMDIKKEVPKLVFKNPNDIIDVIESKKYVLNNFERFRKKYLPEDLGESTNKISKHILKQMKRVR